MQGIKKNRVRQVSNWKIPQIKSWVRKEIRRKTITFLIPSFDKVMIMILIENSKRQIDMNPNQAKNNNFNELKRIICR